MRLRFLALLLGMALTRLGPEYSREPEPETVLRLFSHSHAGTSSDAVTIRPDPTSRSWIDGQVRYTRWREDEVSRRDTGHIWITVTYHAADGIHCETGPAFYRLEMDHAPAICRQWHWHGQLLESKYQLVDRTELDAMIRELGIEF